MSSPRLPTVEHLSKLIDIPVRELFDLTHNVNARYQRRQKQKPNGGFRIYFVPEKNLKRIQKLIHKKYLTKLPLHSGIHSYRRRRDTISNASVHVGKSVLVKLDIKDFFPSINPLRVYKMFLERGCGPQVARLLTQLTTFSNQLPQGPPTSPGIANQILMPLARRIDGLCDQHGLAFSIFGDDICVSGSMRAEKVNNLLKRIVHDEGFSINPRKSEVRGPGMKKTVTGISVSQKINCDKNYYRTVRALVHHAVKNGYIGLFPGVSGQAAKTKLQGMVGYIMRLNPQRGEHLKRKLLADN